MDRISELEKISDHLNLDSIKREIDDLIREKETIKIQIIGSKKRISIYLPQKESLRKQVEKLFDQNYQLKNELSSYKTEIDTFNKQYGKLMSDNTSLQHEYEILENKMNVLIQKIENLDQRKKKLTKMVENKLNEISMLQKEYLEESTGYYSKNSYMSNKVKEKIKNLIEIQTQTSTRQNMNNFLIDSYNEYIGDIKTSIELDFTLQHQEEGKIKEVKSKFEGLVKILLKNSIIGNNILQEKYQMNQRIQYFENRLQSLAKNGSSLNNEQDSMYMNMINDIIIQLNTTYSALEDKFMINSVIASKNKDIKNIIPKLSLSFPLTPFKKKESSLYQQVHLKNVEQRSQLFSTPPEFYNINNQISDRFNLRKSSYLSDYSDSDSIFDENEEDFEDSYEENISDLTKELGNTLSQLETRISIQNSQKKEVEDKMIDKIEDLFTTIKMKSSPRKDASMDYQSIASTFKRQLQSKGILASENKYILNLSSNSVGLNIALVKQLNQSLKDDQISSIVQM